MFSTPTKTRTPECPPAPKKGPKNRPNIIHSSQLPRIKPRGLVEEFDNIIEGSDHNQLYNSIDIGNNMESVFATSDQYSRYKDIQSNMVNIDYMSDFTLDFMFRTMNIREQVDERMAMEIAGFIRRYLPFSNRPFNKTSITVNSVDTDGNPVTKVLEVKLYYAYEADAVQWLVKSFFNRSDLINERHRIMNAMISLDKILETYSLFVKNDSTAINAYDALSFQNDILASHITSPSIFTSSDVMINGYNVYSCAGIFTMYMERFADSHIYIS